jgi:hypothetical protein
MDINIYLLVLELSERWRKGENTETGTDTTETERYLKPFDDSTLFPGVSEIAITMTEEYSAANDGVFRRS